MIRKRACKNFAHVVNVTLLMSIMCVTHDKLYVEHTSLMQIKPCNLSVLFETCAAVPVPTTCSSRERPCSICQQCVATHSCCLQAAQKAQTHADEQARSHSAHAKQQSDRIQELSDKLVAVEALAAQHEALAAQHEAQQAGKTKELADGWTQLQVIMADYERMRAQLTQQLTTATIGKPNILSAQYEF